MKIVVSGAGMRRPAEHWLAVNIGPSIKIAKLAKRPRCPEAKYLSLEEARQTGAFKQFAKEHPSEAGRERFLKLLIAMSQGA